MSSEDDKSFKYVVTAVPKRVTGGFDVPVFCKNQRGGTPNRVVKVSSFENGRIPRPGDDMAIVTLDVGRTRLPTKPAWVQKRLTEMALACGAFGGGTKGAMEFMNKYKGKSYTTMWKDLFEDSRNDKWAMWMRCNSSPSIRDQLYDIATRAGVNLTAQDVMTVEEKLDLREMPLEEVLVAEPYEFARLVGSKKSMGILKQAGVDSETLENVVKFETFESCMRQNGHVCVPLAEVSDKNLSEAIRHLRAQGLLVQHNKCLYTQCSLKWDYLAAKNITLPGMKSMLSSIVSTKELHEESMKRLNDEQSSAMKSVLSGEHTFNVLAARAGCGKTYFVATLIDVLDKLGGVDILYCAPTHRATRRIGELVSDKCKRLKCMTLQKLCVLSKGGVFDKLTPAMLVVDEVSMADAELFHMITELVVKFRLHCLLVGDDMQLPSVSNGDVLKQLLMLENSKSVSSVGINRLTSNMRLSSNKSALCMAIHDVVNRSPPIPASFTVTSKNDFAWFPTTTEDNAKETLRNVCKELFGRYEASDIMCIACRHVDVDLAQEVMRNQLSPAGEDVFGFRMWDRVVTSMIDEDNNIFNTLRGVVTSAKAVRWSSRSPGLKDIAVTVTFDNGTSHVFNRDDIHLLRHGYCSTTHVAQGSECKCVVIFLPATYGSRMHTRTMLYTAMTRATDECIIVGSKQAVSECLTRDMPGRHSNLASMVKRFEEKNL